MDTNVIVFRAIEILILALGSMIWWHVRRADRLLERLTGRFSRMREEHSRLEMIVRELEHGVGTLSTQADATSARITAVEHRVSLIEQKHMTASRGEEHDASENH